MATTKTPIATDSAEELRDLIGDDASATFESDPNFVDSNATDHASSENIALRDTDDTEDSEEEDEEVDEEDDDDEDGVEDDDDEDEDDEEGDEDDEEEEEEDDFDEEEDDDAEVLKAAEPVDVHGPGKHSRADIEEELEEMEEETAEENGGESPDDVEGAEATEEAEELHTDLAIDEALRMSATSIVGQLY